ncbi:MAG: hypothetical protein LQ352_005721, partial [Teloschistes flavicans]
MSSPESGFHESSTHTNLGYDFNIEDWPHLLRILQDGLFHHGYYDRKHHALLQALANVREFAKDASAAQQPMITTFQQNLTDLSSRFAIHKAELQAMLDTAQSQASMLLSHLIIVHKCLVDCRVRVRNVFQLPKRIRFHHDPAMVPEDEQLWILDEADVARYIRNFVER